MLDNSFYQVLVYYGLVKEMNTKRGNWRVSPAIQVLGKEDEISDSLRRIFKLIKDTLLETKSTLFEPLIL